MSAQVRFAEHEQFHQETLQACVAGGLGALGMHVLSLLFPQTTLFAHGGAWMLGGVGAAVAYALTMKRSSASWLLRVIFAGVLGAAALLFFGETGTRPEPALGLASWAAAFGVLLASGRTGWRWVGVAAGASAGFLLGRYVSDALYHGIELGAVPPFLRAALGGAAFGLLAAIGAGARHLSWKRDMAKAAHDSASPRLSGELRDLADHAYATHTRIVEVLEGRRRLASEAGAEQASAQIRETSQALVIQICGIGSQWQEIETEGARTAPEGLAARLASLDAKLEKTTDPVAREQYGLARASLLEQQRYLDELSAGRERVIARTHAHLAALEKLRLAVLNHRSVDAQRLALAVQPLLEEIRALSVEIDIRSQALGEADAEAEAARTAAKAAPVAPN